MPHLGVEADVLLEVDCVVVISLLELMVLKEKSSVFLVVWVVLSQVVILLGQLDVFIPLVSHSRDLRSPVGDKLLRVSDSRLVVQSLLGDHGLIGAAFVVLPDVAVLAEDSHHFLMNILVVSEAVGDVEVVLGPLSLMMGLFLVLLVLSSIFSLPSSSSLSFPSSESPASLLSSVVLEVALFKGVLLDEVVEVVSSINVVPIALHMGVDVLLVVIDSLLVIPDSIDLLMPEMSVMAPDVLVGVEEVVVDVMLHVAYIPWVELDWVGPKPGHGLVVKALGSSQSVFEVVVHMGEHMLERNKVILGVRNGDVLVSKLNSDVVHMNQHALELDVVVHSTGLPVGEESLMVLVDVSIVLGHDSEILLLLSNVPVIKDGVEVGPLLEELKHPLEVSVVSVGLLSDQILEVIAVEVVQEHVPPVVLLVPVVESEEMPVVHPMMPLVLVLQVLVHAVPLVVSLLLADVLEVLEVLPDVVVEVRESLVVRILLVLLVLQPILDVETMILGHPVVEGSVSLLVVVPHSPLVLIPLVVRHL